MVFFPNGAIPDAAELSLSGSYLLTFVWSDTSPEALHAYNEMVNGELEDVIARHGGSRLSAWQAVGASQGLGAAMAPMELWHFDDLEGFFRDPESQNAPQPEFGITKRYFLQLFAR